MGRGPWLVVVIACKTRFTLVNDPDDHIRIAMLVIRMYCGAGALMEAVRMSMLCKCRLFFFKVIRIKSAPCVLYRKIWMRMTRMTMRAMCHCKMRATYHCKMRATCFLEGGVPTQLTKTGK